MHVLTRDAVIKCDHGGRIAVEWTQTLVRIDAREVLVRPDPEGRDIKGCPNLNPVIGLRACHKTLAVKEGYSTFVRIGGQPVCLSTVKGLTDGTPPGLTTYKMLPPGQQFVRVFA